jgi:actin-related protein
MIPLLDTNVVVIDNGTGLIKAGLGGDDAPRSIFPTVVGKPKVPSILVGLDQKDVYIGEEVREKKGVVKLEYPIERAIIKDWENMERIWNYTMYQELHTIPEEQGILLTEPLLNPREHREKTVRIMFETFNVPYLYLSTQTMLALYSSGKTTGLVVDIGEGMGNVVPIDDGLQYPLSCSKFPIAGKDLTLYLQAHLRKKGYNLPAADEYDWIQWVKESLCQVALDYEAVVKESTKSNSMEKEQLLPDGNTIVKIGLERYQTPEVLFNPMIAGKELKGIQHHIVKSLSNYNKDTKKEMCKSIILVGGTTMFPFIGERMKFELERLIIPKPKKCRIFPRAVLN